MKIGIDISQLAYSNTGVANYLKFLVENMLKIDQENEYILFYSSLRRKFPVSSIQIPKNSKVTIKQFKLPPKVLDLMWNRLHIMPIEWFIGEVDLFITSDWTEPPVRSAKKATILYDLIVYKYPQETDILIQNVQKRKHVWVQKESDMIFAISEATKKDAMEILNIKEDKISVIYPGMTI